MIALQLSVQYAPASPEGRTKLSARLILRLA